MEQVRKNLGLTVNQDTRTVDLPDFDIEEMAVKNWNELLAEKNLGRAVYLLIERSQRMQSKFLYFNLLQREREATPPVEQYKYVEICLAYLFFNALPFWEKDDLVGFLQQHTLALLEIDKNPAKSIIDEYLFLEPEELTELSKKCLGALRASQEKILDSEQRKLKVGGVITAYLAFASRPERVSIDEISFLNNGEEIRRLSADEKGRVLSVLKFYDHLEFPLLNLEQQSILKTVSSATLTPAGAVLAHSLPSPTVPASAPKQILPQMLKPSALSAPAVSQSILPIAKSVPLAQPVFAPPIERYDAVAEKLIKESGLDVAPELQQRFKMIVVSRLKEVRGWVETRQKLMSPVAQGGMGFAYDDAEKFVKLVDEKKDGLLKNSLIVAPSVVAFSKLAPPPPIPVTTLVLNKVLPPKENFSKGSPLRHQPPPVGGYGGGDTRNDKNEIASSLAAPRNDIKKTSSDIQKISPQPLKIIQQEKSAPKIELAPLSPVQIKPVPKIVIPQTPAGRSKMEDVAYKPRLVGPVEELREMSLVDFRRLSPQAKVTADKIYAKIELLAEESYEKKILGIKAWQESEVNKMYLGLLNESVDAAKPMQKMIEERQGANKPTLTYEEFKVVMELNRRLRN
ncbi:MAG: hypothetical protein UU49_C0008G0017 [Candidatus Magasanikbacteria bacterium GW2011_GWC2_41_17]|uniref:Uncharacterized protein n=1 Tax=Candidatus Magasanikbacteria bacterium GW2011_GWC2_41_17 TaxID=1619048 RepID=A0A0G0YG23_9BACT|nr:MAG: hypothetical protein UU49_C0008G0017 [Candidatus Magasanikbacteria bacterium GW2011_GWC2_41_17]